ncbi:Phosphoribosyl pyrophosphate synthetase-associated protein 2 [Paragonimus heterotremus]|uniref:Phosphoribosyl pyrophosphate synthetase-associated protein 2 n=1 Tax=Paragonimus heterotremus TaxID=100268 RepID=A0A8J4TJ80_9TREM|nr:Phosphoribosyl pyrophosphate synthetase-associated protein 2 [Paragonimus heterotremus]
MRGCSVVSMAKRSGSLFGMASLKSKGMVILAGNSHPELVTYVCRHLDAQPGKCLVYFRTSRETMVELRETVRGRDVYILQSGTKDVNNDIMELLILAYSAKSACARKVIAVVPYLPYCKQSKRRKRGPITCKLLAKMLCASGINHVITLDLHSKEIQGFFDVPVDNLRASPFLIKYIETYVLDYRNAVIVARNPSIVPRATSYAERLRLPLVVIHGEDRDDSEHNDGRNSPPLESLPTERRVIAHVGLELLPMMVSKAKPPPTLVGDVNGRIAIIVDDIIDDVAQFVKVADLLHERGAYKVFVFATHGLLSADAPQQLEESHIDEVVVTNTVPHEVQKMQCHKIRTVDISVLLAEAIRRIHNDESMSYLFTNVPKDD